MKHFVTWMIALVGLASALGTAVKDTGQDHHRNLQTCEEDDAFFVIMICKNVCGVDGLEFHAEDIATCAFEGTADAENQARTLGCPNVGAS